MALNLEKEKNEKETALLMQIRDMLSKAEHPI